MTVEVTEGTRGKENRVEQRNGAGSGGGERRAGRGGPVRGGDGITRGQFLARGAAFAFAAAVTGPGLTILSGCGGAGTSEPMSFWNFYAPGGENPGQEKWFVDTVEAWNRDHEAKVELSYTPPEEYVNGAKLQTAFASGEGPDIFLISPGDFLRYYNGGVLQDLTPFLEDGAREDFYPEAMQTRLVDGKIHALPMEVEPLVIYYSTRAFEEVGISEGDIPKTWDALLGVAGRLKTSERFGILFDTNPGYYQNFTWYPFMWMGGGEAVTSGGKGTNFDSEGTIQALRFWQEAVESGVAPRQALGYGANDIVSNLGSGYCAMEQCGIWGVSDLRANAADFEYGVFTLPLPPGGRYTTDLGGWSFVANSKGKNPEAAGEFCAWALGSMSEDSVGRCVSWITEAKEDLSPRASVMDRAAQEGAFESEVMRIFRDEAFPGGRSEPRYPPEVYKPVSDAIQACQLNGADPGAEARRAAEQIDTFLQGYSGAPIV